MAGIRQGDGAASSSLTVVHGHRRWGETSSRIAPLGWWRRGIVVEALRRRARVIPRQVAPKGYGHGSVGPGCVLRGCVHVIIRGDWTTLGARKRWPSLQGQRIWKGRWVFFPPPSPYCSGSLRVLECLGWLSQAFNGTRLKLHDMFTRREDAMV